MPVHSLAIATPYTCRTGRSRRRSPGMASAALGYPKYCNHTENTPSTTHTPVKIHGVRMENSSDCL